MYYKKLGVILGIILVSVFAVNISTIELKMPSPLVNRVVREDSLKFNKESVALKQVPEGTFMQTEKGDSFFKILKQGKDFAYARLNEELGILEIEPLSNTQIRTNEARKEFYEDILEFTYQEIVAQGKGIELVTKDMDLMKVLMGRKEAPKVKNLEFTTDNLEGVKHWYGKDEFFQMEFRPQDESGKMGMLTFKPSNIEGSGGYSAIIQPKITILVNGYGTVGSKVAIAARRNGFNVVVAKRSVDAVGRAYDAAIDKGFSLYLGGDAEFYQDHKDEFEKEGIPVKGSIEGLLSRQVVDLVIDASPKPYGARNKEEYYDKYGVKFILQGGEKDEVVDTSFSSSTTPWEKLKDVNSVRIVSCNTTAMARVYGAILKNFENVVIDNLAIRRAADPWQSGRKGIIDTVVLTPAYHHGPDFLTVLSQNLLDNMAKVDGKYAINTDAGKAPTTHFHMHQGTVRLTEPNPEFTVEKVKDILSKQPRIALTQFPEGEFKTNILFEMIDKQLHSPDAYVIFAQVLPSSIPGEIKLTFAVPQENDVVPENVNALQAMFGLFGKKAGTRIVNEVLGIDYIKPTMERKFREGSK